MATYVKISYNVSSSTNPTSVARYAWMSEPVEDWIDHVTIGSSGGTVITIEPLVREGYDTTHYAYTFPSTGIQDLYFFSKTNEIPDYAFIGLDGNSYPGHVLSIDCSQSNNDITGIGESTFSNNMGMQSAYLSDNITRIGRNAFEADSAMAVCNVPESLSAIPASMFSTCYSLQHVRIPDSVQSIGASAFAYCSSLEDVYLGSGLTSFNTFAFGGCSGLTSITATSRNVPITYYTNTFQGVHTGGTLYYPAGYESEYGPESGMLGTQQYLLGYYDWNGAPTGQTDITDIFAGYAENYNMPAVDSPFSAGKFLILFYYSPTDAQIDLQVTSSNNNLFFNPHYNYSGISSDYSGYAYKAYLVNVSKTVTGSSVITAVDRNTGLEASRRIYKVTSAATPNLFISPSAYTFASGASYDVARPGIVLTDIIETDCTLDPDTTGDQFGHIGWSISNGNNNWTDYDTYSIYPNSLTKKLQATKIVPNTGDTRWFIGDTVFNDTSGNSYLTSFKISQEAGSGYTPTPSDRWVYLNPSAATYAASVNGSRTFTVRASGCTIDSARTPVFTLSGDTSWFSIQQSRFNSSGYWQIYLNVSRNLTTSARDAYISVLGVYDTDGNRYNDLVFHATQNWGSYVFLNYNPDNNMTSGGGIDTIEAVGVNTTVCSISLTYSGTTTPEYWEGVEQPTWTALGNYLTINWPANPFNADRKFNFSTRTIWGDNCESNSSLGTGKWQDAAPAPVQKDIKAADTDYSVGSGTGNASTTIQTSGCTYDHFTYVTGGSFSVTATSGPNNTIVFTYPENPTTSPRTGYVYITFYDNDGNSYGPQTITFTQQAGSSPGPGPGPDPETGYVLTTLTISDQEQHRYFVEARPGVVYSAAGQYYKTIPACEARYSLYYVNSYGGVDVLPFKGGGQKKTDNITRFNYSRSFRNNTPEFENVNYMNEIKAVWELQTGWIGDDGSSRMHELVESTIVYLYDAEEKTYTPVVMTDKKLEYKTYHNQGKKFYNYTVNVEESQSKERR